VARSRAARRNLEFGGGGGGAEPDPGDSAPFGRIPDEEEVPESADPDTDPDEDEDEADEADETSIEDIVRSTDPERFDRTFLAETDNFGIGGAVSPPTTYPLQALPRLAYVLNFNLAYNDTKDRWEPQKKSDLGATVVLDANDVTVGANSLLISGTTEDLADHPDKALKPVVSPKPPDVPTGTTIAEGEPDSADNNIVYGLQINPPSGQIRIEIENNLPQDFDLRVVLLGIQTPGVEDFT